MTSKTERSGPGAPRNSTRRWLALGGVAAGGAFLAGRNTASPAPQRPSTSRIPDVPLVTHDGRSVRFYSDLVRGKVVFINMMYAQCSDRCPPMTQNLRRVHEALGPRAGTDVFMYSITLLPEFDRPSDLAAYMQQQRVGPNWTFLTGRKDDIEQLRRGLGFSDPDPELDADISRHTGMVRVGNDALDRWTMAPAMVGPDQILECLMSVDPKTRATGRIRTT
jgi:protein SCO1